MVRLVTTNEVRKLDAASRETLRDPSTENVHHLRVIIRRLRSQLWLVPKNKRTKLIRRATKDLKQIASVLGDQRKYDVAITDARRLNLPLAPLEKKQRKAHKKIPKALQDRAAIRNEVKEAVKDANEVSASSLISQIERLQDKLRLEKIPHSQHGRHELRIAVKRARYILKSFGLKNESLHALQDKLGRWHDLVTLLEIVGPNPRVERELEKQWSLIAPELRPALSSGARSLARLKKHLK